MMVIALLGAPTPPAVAAEMPDETPPAVAAENPDETPPAYRLRAHVTAGYRLVDIDGAKDKYREDFDLRSGGRLFEVEVDGRARDPDTTYVDRFHLEVDRPHDEPVSRVRLRLADQKLYELRAAFTKSTYIYDVPRLFLDPVADVRRRDDLHTFDLERTHGSIELAVRPRDETTVRAGYDFHRREGDTVTTRFVPGADTYLLGQDVDARTHVGFLGAETRWLGTDVALRQEFRRTDRSYETDGPEPGGRLGLDPGDADELTFLQGDQDERIDAPLTSVRVRRAVGDRAEFTGGYVYTHVDLDVDGDLLRDATTDAPGFPDRNARTSDGDATLDAHVVDLGAELIVHERVRVHAGYRFDERSQDGDLERLDAFGRIVATTGYDVQQHRLDGDVRVQLRDDLSLRAGLRYGYRDARFRTSPESFTTDAFGVLADLRYEPWEILDLFARYENLQIDDPVTTPGASVGGFPVPGREIVLTFVDRGSVGFRLTPIDWVTLGHRFTADRRENDSFGGISEAYGNQTTLDLTPLPDLTVFLSYARRDVDDEGDIRVAPTYAAVTSLQRGSEDVVLAQLDYGFGLLGERWSARASAAYSNSEQTLRPAFEPTRTRTAFDLDRIDVGAALRLHHAWLEPAIEFRFIEYDERVLPVNDYRATIVTFSLTKRWSR